MKITIALIAALATAGCSAKWENPAEVLHPADVGDAVTTMVAVAGGAVEANPVVGVLGDQAAGPLSLALTYGARSYYNANYPPEQAALYNQNITNVKTGLTCNGLAVIAGAATPVSLLLGAGCGWASWHFSQ